MNFISFAFVFLFIPVFVARLTIWRYKTDPMFQWAVLGTSTVFVIWHVPVYILIMLVSIGTDFYAARHIDRRPDGDPLRKWLLAASLSINLLLLGAFKYTNFAGESLQHLLRAVGSQAVIPTLDIVLPMGISFYTFGSMSYTIDVYRRRMSPVRRFRDFYFFVTFFPHMVAGPIIRAEYFFDQFARRRQLLWISFNEGAWLISRGILLKMVCADNLGSQIDKYWSHEALYGTNSLTLWGLAILFGFQIYCDFAGYSDIARGLAYWMGFRFPINFNNPYLAHSFSNFWERWHITLSTWLRDYLYIPLGGNRISSLRTYVNLLTVMVLGGLWHGAAYTYLVWGAIHGLALAVERFFGLNRTSERGGWIRYWPWYVLVQVIVLIAWVFFRSESLDEALSFTRTMMRCNFAAPPTWLVRAAIFTLPPILVHAVGFVMERGGLRRPRPIWKAALTGVFLFVTLVGFGRSSAFIYFQF